MKGEQSKLSILKKLESCLTQHEGYTAQLIRQLNPNSRGEMWATEMYSTGSLMTIIQYWRTTKDEFTQLVDGMLAYWEHRQDNAPITYARLEKIVSLWEALPDITSIVKQIDKDLNINNKEARYIVNNTTEDELNKIENYYSQVDKLSKAMGVLTFWEDLYQRVKTAGHIVEVAITTTPKDLRKVEWKPLHDAGRHLTGLRYYLSQEININDLGVGTCTDFTFVEEREIFSKETYKDIIPDGDIVWDTDYGDDLNNEVAINLRQTLMKVKRQIDNLLSDLEKAGQPAVLVKGQNLGGSTPGTVGGGRKALETRAAEAAAGIPDAAAQAEEVAAETDADTDTEVSAGEGAAEAAAGASGILPGEMGHDEHNISEVHAAWKKIYEAKGITGSNQNIMKPDQNWVKGMVDTVRTCDSTVDTMLGTPGKRRWQALREVYKDAYGIFWGMRHFNKLKNYLRGCEKGQARVESFINRLHFLADKIEEKNSLDSEKDIHRNEKK